jgi:hypothetical protein
VKFPNVLGIGNRGALIEFSVKGIGGEAPKRFKSPRHTHLFHAAGSPSSPDLNTEVSSEPDKPPVAGPSLANL